MKALRRAIGGALALVLVYFAAAGLGAVIPGKVSDPGGAQESRILLVSGPIHYDILLPITDETRNAFAFLTADGLPVTHPDAAWLVVGWGSRAFYTATGGYRDLEVATVWTAATGDASVLRFEVLGAIDPPADWLSIAVSTRQLAALRGAILREFARDGSGGPIVVPGAGLTDTDVFYAAQSRFSLFRTCNVWIGQVLREAGVPMGVWTPTPYAVTLSRWWFS